MDLGLAGKTALVTGSTSGIGLAIARKLGEEGCTVVICGRDAGKLDTTLGGLRRGGIKAEGFAADMEQPGQIADLVHKTLSVLPRIDIVVSNAGTHVQGLVEEITAERLEAQLRAKVIGPWELARQVAPHMKKQGGGRFIVIIGQAGKVPGINVIASAVSNAAQHAFVKSLSDDLGRYNITVNAVCPSRITSPLTDSLTLYNEIYLGRSLEQQESGWGREVPLGRWGVPEDIANAVAFIASERAGFIVGSNIDVDGGHQRSILLIVEALIRVEDLHKSFRKDKEVVEAVAGFELAIRRREIVAVIGPSGCGKSTLLHMMAGLYRPSRGRVLYDGRMVTNVNTAVAYMTQKDSLLPWRKVRDNVAFPLEVTGVARREREARADEVLQRMGLGGFEGRYPSELSGGMRKRACLARMLLQGAESLLLDEPFAALDAQLKLAMQTLLLRLASEAGHTVVFVTHDLAEAVTLADRVIVCTRRPARIALEQVIDLPRPRDAMNVRFERRFKQLYDAIWERLRQEYEEEAV